MFEYAKLLINLVLPVSEYLMCFSHHASPAMYKDTGFSKGLKFSGPSINLMITLLSLILNLIALFKSFIYIRNSQCPKTDPWGTPIVFLN